MHESSFLSIDWGTTNLRIRWVQLARFEVLAEHFSDQGVKKVYHRWQASGRDREAFFLEVLQTELQTMGIQWSAKVKVIISGMASSSIGMRELHYASLPFFANGHALSVEKWQPKGFLYEISLISGVKSKDDVMRGEELNSLVYTSYCILPVTVYSFYQVHTVNIFFWRMTRFLPFIPS